MPEDQLKKLAETLKNNGLAVSMYEALEKAKSILNVKSQNDTNGLENDDSANDPNPITQRKESLNELMEGAGVDPHEVDDQEREKADMIKNEVVNIKEELKDARGNQEKINHIKDEISEVREQMAQIPELDSSISNNSEDSSKELEAKNFDRNVTANQPGQAEQDPIFQDEFSELDEIEEKERKNNSDDFNASSPQISKKPNPDLQNEDSEDNEKIDLTKVFGNGQ